MPHVSLLLTLDLVKGLAPCLFVLRTLRGVVLLHLTLFWYVLSQNSVFLLVCFSLTLLEWLCL